MIARLPEKVRTRSVVEAVVSPSAILLAGAGTAIGIATGLGPLAVLVGAAGWAARVAFAIPRKPADQRIDPFRVREPWRRFVVDALEAQRRFNHTADSDDVGPIRDRLLAIGRRIDVGVMECWRIAQLGDELGDALHRLDIGRISESLRAVDHDLASARAAERAPLLRTRDAILSQLSTADRIRRTASDTQNRLRVLTAQLNEAVARAIELSLHTGDNSVLAPLSDDVDSVVDELELLRQGIEETSGKGDTSAAG